MRLFQPEIAGDLNEPAATGDEERLRVSNQSPADTETPVTLSYHECGNSSYGSRTMQNRHDIGGDDTNDMSIQHGNQTDIVASCEACRNLWC